MPDNMLGPSECGRTNGTFMVSTHYLQRAESVELKGSKRFTSGIFCGEGSRCTFCGDDSFGVISRIRVVGDGSYSTFQGALLFI